MTQRMIDILKAIVDEFVATAEPVGSKTLVDKYRLPYSSATIRNDMATLEQMGFLEKPHTSAGRIPSNKGYQFYCEHLLEKNVDDEVKFAISNIFSNSQMNIEDALKESCKMISDMTQLTSGMLGPDASSQTLRHLDVYPLDEKNAVCIFVTNTGHTENKTFRFKDEVTAEDIKKCSEILNDRLVGTPVNELGDKLQGLKPIMAQQIKRHEMLFNAFLGAFTRFATEHLYSYGTSNMMYQPEYSDLQKLQELVKVIDNPEMMRQLSQHSPDGDDVLALTPAGTEMMWKDEMAIITSEVKMGRKPDDKARIMVVGPRRMEYNKVVSLMDFVSRQIEELYK